MEFQLTFPAYVSKEVRGSFQSIPRESLQIMNQGQYGVPWRGEMCMGRCFPGWAGTRCTLPVGILPADLISLPTNVSSFYAQCFFREHGYSTKSGMLTNTCTCHSYFGPQESLPFNWPCGCPSSTIPTNEYYPLEFIMNNDVYAFNGQSYYPCGGQYRGQCSIVDDLIGGQCFCTSGLEGSNCACPASIPFYDGYVINQPGVTTQPCSGHGECTLNGCVCDVGWTGSSCTCAKDLDWVQATQAQIVEYGNNGIQVLFSTAQYIANVTLSAGCVAYNVTLNGQEQLLPAYASSIEIILTSGTWNLCTVQAYSSSLVEPCGQNQNPSASRLLALTKVRPNWATVYPGQMAYGPYGCTATDCLCSSGYGGALCLQQVSSWSSTNVITYCGETSEPVRGQRSTANGCVCQGLVGADPTGILNVNLPFFNNTACACLYFENPNTKTIQECGGLGTCIQPLFPSGYCDFDLDAWNADALRWPFVPNGDGCNLIINRIFSFPPLSSCSGLTLDERGWEYGIFWQSHPALDYSLSVWTLDHYSFLASLTNGETCGDAFEFSDENLLAYINETRLAYTFNELYDSIIVNITWPLNTVWDTLKPSSGCRALNISNPSDQ